MKCPRTFQIEITEDDQIKLVGADCIKEECACWDSLYERCDPTGLARILERITDSLTEIERKMPHAGQFTK